MEKIDYNTISSGVRDLVRELREVHDMDTMDSGDGSNYKEGMECALPDRHVFMRVDKDEMIEAAEFLKEKYPEAHVECNWSPGGTAVVMLFPDGQFTGV